MCTWSVWNLVAYCYIPCCLYIRTTLPIFLCWLCRNLLHVKPRSPCPSSAASAPPLLSWSTLSPQGASLSNVSGRSEARVGRQNDGDTRPRTRPDSSKPAFKKKCSQRQRDLCCGKLGKLVHVRKREDGWDSWRQYAGSITVLRAGCQGTAGSDGAISARSAIGTWTRT